MPPTGGEGGEAMSRAHQRIYYPPIDLRSADWKGQAKSRAEINIELLERGIKPTYNPLIIGEHEVEPVRCQCCGTQIPWSTIKGWRD